MKRLLHIHLKTAIIESRRTQKRIASLTNINETQLSHLVNGRRTANATERAALVRVLNRSEAELFPELHVERVSA